VPLRTGLLLLAVAVVGALLVGAITATGAVALHVIGLYEVVAAAALAMLLSMVTHSLGRPLGSGGVAIALVAAVAWLLVDEVVSASIWRLLELRRVAARGLELADALVVSGADGPGALVDASLLADTGRDGWQGAWLLRFEAGVRVSGALERVRVLAAPPWVHGVFLGARAAIVAFWIRRALSRLDGEPVCSTCGRFVVPPDAARCPEGHLQRSEADPPSTAAEPVSRPLPHRGG
jgi:hypothetical protein